MSTLEIDGATRRCSSPSSTSSTRPRHRVHILARGRIVESGGPELATRLETEGDAAFAGENDAADVVDGSASALGGLLSL